MGKKNGGFTLVEMLATIVCASIVTLTAMSFLLMCMRLWASAQEDISRQETERIVLTAMENLAEDDAVKEVRSIKDGSSDVTCVALLGDETVGGGSRPVLLYFDASRQTISTGGTYISTSPESYTGGSVLMEGVDSFSAELSGRLLTFTLKMSEEDKGFSTSVYCRTGDVASTATAASVKSIYEGKLNDLLNGGSGGSSEEKTARSTMLGALVGQIGSTGEIRGAAAGQPQYFSEWYKGKYTDGWDENTPWCACFVSWGIAQVESYLDYSSGELPRFANVNTGMNNFKTTGGSSENYGTWIEKTATVGTPSPENLIPGDLIFFDWEEKGGHDGNPDHVGVVLFTENGRVYTIEGNSGSTRSAAVHSYDMNDECILGYGRLKWKQTAEGSR